MRDHIIEQFPNKVRITCNHPDRDEMSVATGVTGGKKHPSTQHPIAGATHSRMTRRGLQIQAHGIRIANPNEQDTHRIHQPACLKSLQNSHLSIIFI